MQRYGPLFDQYMLPLYLVSRLCCIDCWVEG